MAAPAGIRRTGISPRPPAPSQYGGRGRQRARQRGPERMGRQAARDQRQRDDGRGRAGVHAQQAGVGQRVAGERLDQRAGHGQRRAGQEGEQRARHARGDHQRRVAVVGPGQRAPYVGGREVLEPNQRLPSVQAASSRAHRPSAPSARERSWGGLARYAGPPRVRPVHHERDLRMPVHHGLACVPGRARNAAAASCGASRSSIHATASGAPDEDAMTSDGSLRAT